MNLINILYEPYAIIIVLSLIITLIAYFIVRNNNSNKEQNEKVNTPKVLLITFITSLIFLVLLKYIINYMNKNNFFQKGGAVDHSERLTIIADDLDYDIMEN